MLKNIRIVMISTFHPGNIGAAARAMKNMGIEQLYLVSPKEYPHPEASSRAAGAEDILDNAIVVNSLEEAISDCPLVIGTSARSRTFPWPMVDAEEAAERSLGEAESGPVAIVFGRERMGLHNEELMQCNYHLSIPANPEYPVLNVSSAIQLVCYELWKANSKTKNTYKTEQAYPTQQEMGLFYQHLEDALKAVGFIIPQHEGKVMTKLKRFFNRGRPEKTELNMLRGILTAIIGDLQK